MKAQEKALVIKLPEDPERQAQLKRKLAEYKQRLEADRPYTRHPELHHLVQEATNPGLAYRIAILEELLKTGEINTWEMSLELARKYGDDKFDLNAFNSACAVIEDYCKTGGQNAQGGTGLH